MSFKSDVKSKFFEDTTASSATYVAAAAQPTTTFTLANTSFGTNTGRKITATTAGTGDGTKTVTIAGTDVNGNEVVFAQVLKDPLSSRHQFNRTATASFSHGDVYTDEIRPGRDVSNFF